MTMITTALRAALMTEPANKWPTFNGGNLLRHEFLTASEAAKCVRELSFQKIEEADVFARTGGDKSDTFWDDMSDEEYEARLKTMEADGPYGIFARGHNVEAWAVSMLKSVELPNEKYMFVGKDQRSFFVAGHRLSGTPDGIHINFDDNSMTLLEFKSSNAPTVSPRPAHVKQVLINMGIIKMLMRHNKLPDGDEKYSWMMDCIENFNTGRLVYIRADNYMDIAEFKIEWDGGEAYNHAMTKARELFVVEDGQQYVKHPVHLKPEGLTNRYMCTFCKKKAACMDIEQAKNDEKNVAALKQILAGDSYEAPRIPFFGEAEKERIISVLLEYSDLKTAAKTADEQAAALREAIIEWVKKQEGRKAKFVAGDNNISVSFSTSERAGGIDKDALKSALEEVGLDIASFEKPSTEVDTLRVTVKAAKQ